MLRLVPAGRNCVRVSAGCSAEADVNAGQHSCSSKRKHRRFVVATGSPAASDFRHCCLLLREALHCFVLATGYPAAGNPGSTAGRGFNPAGGAPGDRRVDVELRSCRSCIFAIPVVGSPALFELLDSSSWAALCSLVVGPVELIREPHVFQLLSAPESFGPPAVELLRSAVVAMSCCCYFVSYQDARASGDTALSSPCWDLLALMRRVVNYHSSWDEQRQVELFDASDNRV
ncbi:hypothetical protein F511_27532 [Dorcoceras hygrometricum]|uniref:Uncharacterized protein n=1 Tax=Dorcoceras hygrometricum TaxID=472368 RepID=A0A2Z7AE34_9LAMI|nr:hypothetical protein F511_27532 [Dorcoceras hygrometricum]